MNLFTLRRLSKKALPYIEKYYREQVDQIFVAERGENYHGLKIKCLNPVCYWRRHFEKFKMLRCECYYHPLAGTPMCGGMSGYYEPEWDEKTIWEAFCGFILWGDRPKECSDREWKKMLSIARFTQKQIDDHAAWLMKGGEIGKDTESGMIWYKGTLAGIAPVWISDPDGECHVRPRGRMGKIMIPVADFFVHFCGALGVAFFPGWEPSYPFSYDYSQPYELD